MDEPSWLSCTDPEQMLEFLLGNATDRKLRLYGCGRYRRCWHFLPDCVREIVEMTERFADNEISWKRIRKTWRLAQSRDVDLYRVGSIVRHRITVNSVSCDHFSWLLAWNTGVLDWQRQEPIRRDQATADANTLRHIFGNPFKPYPAPASWPSTVIQLAASLYQGHDCRLPLSDALEENGHQELAKHFRKEEWHMKGCFAMDFILGQS